MATLKTSHLKSKADAFNATQPQLRDESRPTVRQWHEPIRDLKWKNLRRADARKLAELRGSVPNWQDLQSLRLLAIKYGVDARSRGWI